MEIRKVTPNDASQICGIYNHYIRETAITFETDPVNEEDMQNRIAGIVNAGLPYFVATEDDEIAGYCYIHAWNSKQAYDTTKELTIYLAPQYTGKGLGSQLMQYLIDHIDRNRIHVLISGITVPNDSSVHLHEKFGFKQVSFLKEIGKKFDEWRDVGHWQKIL